MNFKNIILFTPVPVILAACLGGGGGAGTNLAAAAVAGLNLPANVEILVDDSALSGNLAAVNMAASYGWEFVNGTVLDKDMALIHYYYMQRTK